MREIKFRAWDKDYEYMYHNAYPFEHLVYVEMDKNDPGATDYAHKMTDINGKWFYFIVAKDIELMQYTGLRDATGKEIYEDDIIASVDLAHLEMKHSRSIVCIGESKTEGSDNCYAQDYYGVYLEGSAGLLHALLHQQLYVVGNVYENPELLPKEY